MGAQIRPGVVPSSPLGKALGYLKRRWLPLTVLLVDSRVPLDTGAVERNIRRVAVGWNAWLFSGSDAAAQRLCAAASLCATCRRLGVDPWIYLRDVFTAIARGISGNALVEGDTQRARPVRNLRNAEGINMPPFANMA